MKQSSCEEDKSRERIKICASSWGWRGETAFEFTLKETGEVVGIHQLIFGGKTKRCEPQNAVPASTSYDHAPPARFITYLKSWYQTGMQPLHVLSYQ